ncbi:hypothetical protein BJ170DRAFT_593151 [Xylariales sp. AK1849]|nr:hypothetical protein BJ170DRAFT_593151 [Xylariales sp. AK1849]
MASRWTEDPGLKPGKHRLCQVQLGRLAAPRSAASTGLRWVNAAVVAGGWLLSSKSLTAMTQVQKREAVVPSCADGAGSVGIFLEKFRLDSTRFAGAQVRVRSQMRQDPVLKLLDEIYRHLSTRAAGAPLKPSKQGVAAQSRDYQPPTGAIETLALVPGIRGKKHRPKHWIWRGGEEYLLKASPLHSLVVLSEYCRINRRC